MRMRSILRELHALAAWVFVGTIVVQVFLAGAAIANLGGSGRFDTHIDFGYTAVGLASLAVLVTAAAARLPRREVGIAFGLLVLYIVQTALPQFRGSIAVLAALHPVNAMLLFGLGTWYARRAWRARSSLAAAQAAPPATSAGAAAPAASPERG